MPEYVYALHDFAPEHEDEISFHAGERIEVVEKDDQYGDGWWQGRNLQGKVGLFPQSYATSSPATVMPYAQPPASTSGPLHTLKEEPDAISVASDTVENANGAGGVEPETDGVMKATLTDVQKAIEQLGRNDRDGGGSFSYASTRDGDTTDRETDKETDRETDRETDKEGEGEGDGDGEGWHKGTRHHLAEKARAAVLERAQQQPPIEVEMSDESESEDEHAHRFSPRGPPSHISEEDEEDELSDRLNGFAHTHSHTLSTQTAVGQEIEIVPSQEFIVPSPSVTEAQTATARRTTFPAEIAAAQASTQNGNGKERHSNGSVLTPTSPASTTAVSTTGESLSSSAIRAKSDLDVQTAASSTTLPSPWSPAESSPGGAMKLSKSGSTAPSSHPSEWSVEEVVEWAKSKNFDSGICAKFIEHEISGDVLLDLDVNLLKTELEIPAFGKRMRIAHAIAELRRPPSAGSSEPRRGAPAHSLAHSVSSSGHVSLNSPTAQHASAGLAHVMSPESPPHTGDIAGSPAPVLHFRRDSDPGSTFNVSVTDADHASRIGNAILGVGLGITSATGTLDPDKTPQKNRPSHLTLSPSDGALGARAIAGGLIPEEDEEQHASDERSAMSESETAQTPEGRSKRRRMFGRSTGSTASSRDAKGDSASRHSREDTLAASVPASPAPSTTRHGSLEDGGSVRRARPAKAGADAAKPADRLSLFSTGFVGSLGKSRKPPPRYSSFGPEDGASEKPRGLFHIGSHSSRKSARPGTADSASRRSGSSFGKNEDGVKEKEKEKEKNKEKEKDKNKDKEKEKEKDKEGKDPALLRKRSATTEVLPQTGGVALRPGESVIDQIGTPDHNGWMRKKGEHYNSWKLRYFVLQGPHLYYLRSNNKSETKIKGYINIVGYKIIVDENVNPGRYGFRLIHDTDRTHFLSSDEQSTVREWMKALMKATIGRDYTKPVISSCNIPTIPLAVAQTMIPAPRPPSPTARDATQKALRRENPNQLSSRDARVLMGLPSPDAAGAEPKDAERARTDSFFTLDAVPVAPAAAAAPAVLVPPRPTREPRRASGAPPEATGIDTDLVAWADARLPPALQLRDARGAPYGGLALLRLAEAIKGTPADPPVPDAAFPAGPHDDRLDGLFRLFDFLLDNDVKMGSVSINDVRQGNREKVMQLVRALKAWEDKRRAIARTIGRGGAYAGPFMAVEAGPPW